MTPIGAPARTIAMARVSVTTRSRLETSPAAGRVHSTFPRCVNIEWPDGRLLALHGPGKLLAPFAGSLAAWPDPAGLGPGQAVRRQGSRLMLGRVTVDLAGAESVDLSMPPASGAHHLIELLAGWLAPGQGAPALGSAPALAARERMAAGIRAGDAAAFVAGARALVGLGEGLTPAGDDCVLGVLAALWRLVPHGLPCRPDVQRALAEAVETGTTPVARDFVLHALQGRFGEPVIDVMTAGAPRAAGEAAARLRAMGATSGADTLTGIQLALGALASRRP